MYQIARNHRKKTTNNEGHEKDFVEWVSFVYLRALRG